jgi:hypothetical protein
MQPNQQVVFLSDGGEDVRNNRICIRKLSICWIGFTSRCA